MACSDASATLLSDTTIFGFFFPFFPPRVDEEACTELAMALINIIICSKLTHLQLKTCCGPFFFFLGGGPAAGLSTGGL